MQISTKGLILKEQFIGENNKLLTILSENEGLFQAFSKINRKSNKSISASLSPLSFSNFRLYKGRNKYIVESSTHLKVFFDLRKDLKKLSLAQYFCEIAINFKPDTYDSKKILKLILNSLYLLCLAKDSYSISKIKSVVELKACSILGFMPNLVCCNKCKKYTSKTMFFLVDEALLLCDGCYDNNNKSPLSIALSPGSLSALRHIIYAEDNNIFNFVIGPQSSKILFSVTEKFIKHVVDRPFNTLDFYHSISG